MRTAEEFKEQAKKLQLRQWNIRNCSICHAPLRFLFSMDYKHVGFDPNCNCVIYPYLTEERSWEDIARHYNMQTNENVIKTMNEFWRWES